MEKSKNTCNNCKHFYVTYNQDFPWGCKAFGFKSKKMLARLSYTDFDGDIFLKNINSGKKLDDDLVKKYAPNVVEGTHKLVEWSKTL